MDIYEDAVKASMRKLNEVLSGWKSVKFKSGLAKPDAAKADEIVKTILAEIYKYLVEIHNVTIDQVSGRLETKFAELGLESLALSDEQAEQIKELAKESDIAGLEDILPILNSLGSKDKVETLSSFF